MPIKDKNYGLDIRWHCKFIYSIVHSFWRDYLSHEDQNILSFSISLTPLLGCKITGLYLLSQRGSFKEYLNMNDMDQAKRGEPVNIKYAS